MDEPREMLRYLQGGGTLGSILRVGAGDEQNVYACAYDALSSGQSARAATLFTWLTWMNHHEGEYWLALGVARQALSDHEGAIRALARALRCQDEGNPVDPRPIERMVISCRALGRDQAACSLEDVMAYLHAGDDKENTEAGLIEE